MDKSGFKTIEEQNDEIKYLNPIFVDNINFKFIYKKESHLKDWLESIQNKETEIPMYVINRVKDECKAQWLTCSSDLTTEKLRCILKKHKLSNYFENIPYIRNILTGQNFTIPIGIERKIYKMFDMIQEPFNLYKPYDRKSFLSYPYVLHKFFLLLKLPQFCKYFPLLKNRTKLYKQEQVFEKICEHLNWEFIPSV